MNRHIILVASAAVLLAACKNSTDMNSNPFLSAWDTPYEIPDFGRIKPEHYMPAFQEGMRQQKAAIDAIASSAEAPTFANTVEAYEYSGELLDRVSAVFFNLAECENSDEMEAIAEEVTPLLSAHGDDIALNADLFKRIKCVYEERDNLELTPEQRRLLEETYKGFERAGANVPEAQQARFREINEQIASLTLRFGQNVLKATNAYRLLLDGKQVDVQGLGLSPDVLSAARSAAEAAGDGEGCYRFTLHMPSWEPFMQQCTDRSLREQMWRAYVDRCREGEFDNTRIIDSLVNLRLERARILGYTTHADYVLDDCLAKTPQAVYRCLNEIWGPALRVAKQERDQYQRMLAADRSGAKLEPWDWRYYSEKLRAERFSLEDSTLRPYFSLDSVREGAFAVAGRLYGLAFRERTDLPTYDSEAHCYEVMQGDSTVGFLYMDFHPRTSKRSGAWMTEFRGQHRDRQGRNVQPIIQVVCNFTRPTADKPALLNLDESETLFHEFGHALHGLLSRCTYPSLAGTNVPRDFVELPSQVMENWCRHPQVMKQYARHYLTGEPIPDSLLEKIKAAATFGQGFATTELLAASILDMDYYTVSEPISESPVEFEQRSMDRIGLIPEITSRYRSPYFQHIFANGYDAGYYSYTWTAILDADAFEAFEESGDLFNPVLAARFRHLLESGNTVEPMQLYRDFRGKDPSTKALLKRKGLL